MIDVQIFIVMALAMFVQGAAGFGSALIAMPVLLQLVGLSVAAPVFALVAQTGGVLTLMHYREHWHFRSIWRILVCSLIAIPLSIHVAQTFDGHLALFLLGLIMIGYALYALFAPRIPEIKDERWAYFFGFANGVLHGAYNTGGPPLVIYGNARRWQPGEFKSNLQSVFFINGLLVVATHFLSGHVTTPVLHYYLVMLPATVIGLLCGYMLDRYVNPELFRRAVLVLLLILGLSMVFK